MNICKTCRLACVCKKRLKYPDGLSECRIYREGEPLSLDEMSRVWVGRLKDLGAGTDDEV